MLNTENFLQSLHRLPPALIKLALRYAGLSTSTKERSCRDRSNNNPECVPSQKEHHLNRIEHRCTAQSDAIFAANQVNVLSQIEVPLIDLLRRYVMLSSQPVLSESAAAQISHILELAETNDALALLLSEVDRLLLESTDLLSETAKHRYADQTSRILEFLTPLPEIDASAELLKVLSKQCAQSNQSRSTWFMPIAEEPPDLHLMIDSSADSQSDPRANLRGTTRASFEFVSRRSKCLVVALTTIATVMTGAAIVGKQYLSSVTQLSSLQGETARPSTMQFSSSTYSSTSSLSNSSSSTEPPANISRTALLDRQQFEEDQQLRIEQAQFQAEQRQHEAEQKQIVAEKQNQYQEAQYWYHQAQHWYQQAQHSLKQSQVLHERAQDELLQSQLSIPQRKVLGSTSHELHPHHGTPLLASSFPIALSIEWTLFLVLSVLLMLSFTALWKRGFN